MQKKIREHLAWVLCVCVIATTFPVNFSGIRLAWGSVETGFTEIRQTATPSESDEAEEPEWDEDEGDLLYDLATGSNATESDWELEEELAALATASNAVSGFYHVYRDDCGVTVILTAEPEALPEDVEVEIKYIEQYQEKEIADRILKDSGEILTEIFAFDITFFLGGEEFEPEEGAVNVTFDLSDLYGDEGGNRKEIFHVPENEEEIEVMESTDIGGQMVSCLADSFSVYGVAVIGRSADFETNGTTLLKYKGAEKRVVIPSGITIIGRQAFEMNDAVEEIIIPDTVVDIRDRAFASMENLRRLEIGSGLDTASGNMFADSLKLEEIQVNSRNQTFHVEDGVLRERYANRLYYPGGKKDRSYRIPEDVGYIDFVGNPYLEEIYISENVRSVNLQSLTNLSKISADENNPSFCVMDNVLYNKDMTRIICYPNAKTGDTFFVPESVRIIGDGAYHPAFTKIGKVKNICFSGSCPGTDENPVSKYSWLYGFEAGKAYNFYYYKGDSWDALEEECDKREGIFRYYLLHPVKEGFSIDAERAQVVAGNPLKLRVVRNDFRQGILMHEVVSGYWKTESEKYSVSKDGIFIGTAAGKTVVQAGGGEIPEILEIQIEVIESPDKHKEISTSQEWEVLKLTNRERMSRGLDPLSMCEGLQAAAHIRKKELEKKYSHERPNGSGYYTVFDELGIEELISGENIAAGYTSPEEVVKGWMNSPGHRENILTSDFIHMGTGYTRGGETISPSWVQIFVGDSEWLEGLFIDQSVKYRLRKGRRIESLDIPVISYCSGHGVTYIPLIDEMCSGLHSNTLGMQEVTVTYRGFTARLDVEVVSGSAGGSGGGSGSGGGGGGSSSGGGGGGGSSTRSSGIVAAGGPGASASLPSYVVSGNWIQHGDGRWKFVDAVGTEYKNVWAAVYNPYANVQAGASAYDWFRFDENGFMLTGWFTDPTDQNLYYLNPVSDGTCGRMVTGWAMIEGKEYYFNPVSDGTMGRMLRNETTGDGYFVGADGTKRNF